MRDKAVTKDYYVNKLGFQLFSDNDFEGYLMVHKDNIQIHFFEFKDLNPKENYGQVYIRTNDIDKLYQTLLDNNVSIHPNGQLEIKPWGQREFALLDQPINFWTEHKMKNKTCQTARRTAATNIGSHPLI